MALIHERVSDITIQWLQILGYNIFLTPEWQFPAAFYIGFSVGLTSYN